MKTNSLIHTNLKCLTINKAKAKSKIEHQNPLFTTKDESVGVQWKLKPQKKSKHLSNYVPKRLPTAKWGGSQTENQTSIEKKPTRHTPC